MEEQKFTVKIKGKTKPKFLCRDIKYILEDYLEAYTQRIIEDLKISVHYNRSVK